MLVPYINTSSTIGNPDFTILGTVKALPGKP